MKKSRYTAEQVAFAMRQAELGTPVPEWWQRDLPPENSNTLN